MNVLITGGNGLLGHNTILQLLSEGYIVHAIVRKADNVLVQHENLHIFEGDFTVYDSLLLAAKGCEAIIHIAAATDMSLPYSQFEKINVGGSRNIISVARALDIKRIERDENKLQEMYDLGIEDCKNKLEELKEYLKM